MAGAGFKTFNTGDVLTASDVNTYLMQQTVMVFASAAARTTALGANVAEGMLSYLTSTKQVEVYNGTSWVASDDPNAIQNTIVDAKGDIITATANDTPARLAVGANNYFLGAASAETTGLKWLGDWINWTPTLTNLTLGNGTVLANYIQIGKMVTFYFRFTLGSTSSVGTDPRFSLPVTANRTEGGFFNTKLTDSGVGDYVGSALLYNSDIYVRSMNVAATYPSAGNTSATVPFTWGTGDFMIVTGTYEAA